MSGIGNSKKTESRFLVFKDKREEGMESYFQ
jgi:hypothetical protein